MSGEQALATRGETALEEQGETAIMKQGETAIEKTERREKIKIIAADVSRSVEERAREIAEARLTAKKGEAGFMERIWKHNLWVEYYRQREIARIKAEILKNENLFVDEGVDRAHHEAAMASITKQFASEYEDVIHREVGEERKTLPDTEGGRKVKTDMRALVEEYAAKDLRVPGVIEEFNQRKKNALKGLKGASDVVEKGEMYADNLLEVVRQVQTAIAHGKTMAELDLDFDVVVGRARNSVRTEAQFNLADKLIDRITKIPGIGKWINETTAATGVALATGLGSRLAGAAASKAAWLTFGLTAPAGAAIAGMRESKRVAEERRQHARERAQGKRFDPENAPRRKEMEAFMYEMRSATALGDALESSLWERRSDGSLELRTFTSAEQATDALAGLAEIESRIALSDRRNIDLISFSETNKVAEERLRLDVLRAQAKVALRKMGIDFGEGRPFDTHLQGLAEARLKGLLGGEEGVDRKDALFRKMKFRRALKAGAKGLAIGAIVGLAAQEVGAFVRSDQQGAIESLVKGRPAAGAHTSTVLEGAWRKLLGVYEHISGKPATGVHELVMGSGAKFEVPGNVQVLQNPDGTINLLRDGTLVADHLPTDPDGSLSASALNTLRGQGLAVGEHAISLGSGTQSPEDFIKANPGLMKEIRRGGWFDNDTPMWRDPATGKLRGADFNELKAWWGGINNTGINASGDYVYSMKHMTPTGSWHDGLTADAQTLMKAGKLKMLLSMSRGTQKFVFEVPVDANGDAVIPSNSKMGKLLFANVGGKAKFLGHCAEVAEQVGEKNGVAEMRMFATDVGKGIDAITDVRESVKTTIGFPDQPITIEPPPIIPILGRHPLEPALWESAYGYYMYSERLTKERRQKYREAFSESLRENPDATLEQYEEIKNYLEKQDPAYLKQIEALAKQAGSMSEKCRLAVCIPVAGHEEASNIYATLENYTRQTADPESFEIVLFVNHPEKDASGKAVDAGKTIKEIERFQKEHPELKVRMLHEAIPADRARMGYIRKVLNDTVLLRQRDRGEGAPELILVSNDADNKGVAPKYVENFIDRFKANPRVDAYMGQLDWDPASYIRNPLIHVGTRLFQYIEAQSRKMSVASSGANFALRAGVYAAVDGYSPDVNLAEDVDLGSKIRLGREGAREKVAIDFAGARVSRLYTSSRRAEKAAQEGLAPIEQWDRGFGIFDEEVRKVKWETKGKAPDFEDKKTVEKLVRELEVVINRTIRKTGGWGIHEKDSRVRKALKWLGVEFEIRGDRSIKITEASRLVRRLATYQKDGLEIMEMKKGFKRRIQRPSKNQ